MFKKIMEGLQKLANTKEAVFDPARFDDPVAVQTQWTPAKKGGTSFRTHKIIAADPNRLEFKTAVSAKLFYLFFALMGIVFVAIFLVPRISSGTSSLNITTIMPALFGLIFAVIGGVMYYVSSTPIVFDKYKASFWKGRKAPDEVADRHKLKYYTELGNIHALQIISEYVRSNKSSYTSYELNLVLRDGKRINVVDHGNLEKLREDAKTLSSFLSKPVWDAVNK